MFGSTRTRRGRLKESPFPAPWREILEGGVALYSRLSAADREELQGHIQVFLAEKHFEGCNGLEMTDEMRVTIAGQACLLLLHRAADYFPTLSSIVVYPDEYVAPWQEMDESGIVMEGEEFRSGEYAAEGALVVSWRDVLMAGVDDQGAYNVIIHECAHLVDDECGISAGRWGGELGRALEREFHRLQHAAAHGRASLFDHYGASSRDEFFAVATECFFENPRPFRQRHADLYAALCGFFSQDPAAWPGW